MLDGIVAREDVLGVVATKWQVKGGGEIRKVIEKYPLTRRFASRRPMETLKLRVSAQKFKAFSRIDRKAVVLGFDDVVEKVVSLKNARLMGDAVVAPKQEGARAGRHAGDGFRISAFDEECAQAAIRELCAKLRGESAAEDIVEIKAEQLPGERGGLMRKIRTNGGE